jgi:hypothetical protein
MGWSTAVGLHKCRSCGAPAVVITYNRDSRVVDARCSLHSWDEARQFTEIERLKAAIREHRDQRGDDRCWEDDAKLYAVLGEGGAETALPPKAEFLKSCERFYEQRQCPAVKGKAEGMTIAQLEAEIERLRGLKDAIRRFNESAEL